MSHTVDYGGFENNHFRFVSWNGTFSYAMEENDGENGRMVGDGARISVQP